MIGKPQVSDIKVAGRLKYFASVWYGLTSDRHILDIVKNYHIEFESGLEPFQKFPQKPIKISVLEQNSLDLEITKFLEKGIIEKCYTEKGEFISNVFLRLKKDGSFRMILNLKKINDFVAYHKFKMDTLESVIQLVNPGCFMASIDLKDAYYTISIAIEHRKYLRFLWRDKMFQFTCLPNGLASAPRIFTKLLKPIFAHLRLLGHIVVGYIDDTYIQGNNYQDCLENVQATSKILTDCGFVLHPTKSVLVPSQQLIYLGFIIDSSTMTIKMTNEKIGKMISAFADILSKRKVNIRHLAEIIGLIVATFSGAEYGPLHYRILEIEKASQLKFNRGKYESTCFISDDCKSEIQWWIENINHQNRHISHGKPHFTLFSDSSKKGWGGHDGSVSTGGRWTEQEQEFHINYLEILAIFFVLKSFCSQVKNKHVRIFTDNATAKAYINNMGGTRSPLCNRIAKDIWVWCLDRNIWLSIGFVAGKDNVMADRNSRIFVNQTAEWMLRQELFEKMTNLLGKPEIDLFASRLNNQLNQYVSWHPDPGAAFIDAFNLNWHNIQFYAFPPFSLIARCLPKCITDEAEGILITPLWPTQFWFPQLLQLIQGKPVMFPQHKLVLHQPLHPQSPHPLWRSLKLVAWKISGRDFAKRAFQRRPQTSLWTPGVHLLKDNTPPTSTDGFSSVNVKTLIQFDRIYL